MHKVIYKTLKSKKFFISIGLAVCIIVASVATYAYAHVSIASAPTTACGSLDSTSFVTHVTNQVGNRLVGLSTSTSLNLFTTQGDAETSMAGTTTAWVRNTNVWSNQGTAIDWTGISPWNQPYDGYSSRVQKGGTLISPRHVALANHWHMPIGSTLAFVTNDNQIIYRTLTNTAQVGSTDLMVGLLDSDVPDSITYYPVIASSTLNTLINHFTGEAYNIPVEVTGQLKNIGIKTMSSYDSSSLLATSTNTKELEFNESVLNGDSGSPAFIIVDNQPIFLSHVYTIYGGGPAWGNYINEINAAMTSLGGGYQLTEYNPTCFSTYPQNSKPSIFYNSGSLTVFNPLQSTTTVIAYFSGSDYNTSDTLTFSVQSLTGSGTTTPMNFDDFFTMSTTSTTMKLYQKTAIDPALYGSTLTVVAKVTDNVTGNEGIATTSKNISVLSVSGTTNYVSLNAIGETLQMNARAAAIQFDDSGNLVIGGSFARMYNASLIRMGPVKVTTAGALESTFDANAGYGLSTSTTTDSGTVINTIEKDTAGNYIIGSQISSSGYLYTTYNHVDLSTPQRIIKVNSDGVLDTNFITNMGSGFNTGSIFGIKTDSSNNIYVYGAFTSFNGTSASHLVKLNSDGTLNTAFQNNYSTTTFNASIFTSGAFAYDQSSGSIYMGGLATGTISYDGTVYPAARIAKIDSNGFVDATFETNAGTGILGIPTDMEVRPDGKLVIIGNLSSFNGSTTPRIILLNSDGTLDANFTANAGTAFGSISMTFPNSSVTVQPDNKILIGAGSATTYNGTAVTKLIRLNSDGTLDTDFMNAIGTGLIGTGVGRIKVRSDGAIAVGCTCTDFNGTPLTWGGLILLTTKTPETPVINYLNNNSFVVGATTTIATSTVSFSGTGSSTAVVQVYNNGILLATTTVDSTGLWSLSSTLPDGDNSISYSQSLNVLNTATSTVSSSTIVSVDTVAPSAPIILSHSSGSNMASSATITGTCETGSIISASNSGLSSTATSTCSGGIFSLDISWGITALDSTQALSIVASDDVGNSSTTTISVNVFGFPNAPASLTLNSSVYERTPVVSMSCVSGSNVYLYEQSTLLGSTTCSSSSASITSSTSLNLGAHTLIAIQSNVGGTSTASTALTFTLLETLSNSGGSSGGGPLIGIGPSGGGGVGSSYIIYSRTVSTTTINSSQALLSNSVTIPKNKDSTCTPYIVGSIKYGQLNNSADVKKLQEFFNAYEGTSLIINGVYDLNTLKAVNNFQIKYAKHILYPWDLTKPTGHVFKTTIAKINAIVCAKTYGCPYFTEYHKVGDSSDDIKKVKSFLNLLNPVANLNQSSPLYDLKTKAQVADFQIRYRDTVLKPWGLKYATSYWYKTSKASAEEIMGCIEN